MVSRNESRSQRKKTGQLFDNEPLARAAKNTVPIMVWLGPPLLYLFLFSTVALNTLLPKYLPSAWTFEAPPLLGIMNTIFSLIGFMVAFSALRGYLVSGLAHLLFLGCGMLTYGSTGLISGWLGAQVSANASNTIHNTGVLLASLFHLMGCSALVLRKFSETPGKKKRWAVTLATSLFVVGFTAALSYSAIQGYTPAFQVPGSGATLLREIVLTAAGFFFGISYLILFAFSREKQSAFLSYYATALGLITVCIIALVTSKQPNSLLSWLGRSAQFTGGIYFLFAITAAVRTARASGRTLPEEIVTSFRPTEELYRDLVETASDAIILVGPQGEILIWNTAAEQIFGYSREEVGRLVASDLFHPEDARRLFREIETGRAEKRPHIAKAREVKGRRKDGDEFPAELSFSSRPLGSPSISTLIIRDISERKQVELALRESEETLRQARDELEQRVRERTEQLTRLLEELRASENELRHLSSRLLSAQEEERRRISRELHDSIGSALGVIKFGLENALAEIGKGRIPTESLARLVAFAQQTIEEARRMMADLRPAILDDLGLLPTIEWVSHQFQSIYPAVHVERAVGLEEEVIPEELKIVIFRVVQEAFHNIAKYSGAEYVELSLKRKGSSLELTIEDSGKGFDLEAALSRENREKGLGLTSMRERVELSGGSFHIESTLGEGTSIRASWNLAERVDTAPVRDAADWISPQYSIADVASLEGILSEKAARLIQNQTHQVELKVQNEELRQAKKDLEDLGEKSRRLLDRVPIGLLMLDPLGVIAETNFAAAESLQAERAALVGRQLDSWISSADRDLLHLHLRNVFETGERQTCVLRLKREEDSECSVKLTSLLVHDQASEDRCATAITEVTLGPGYRRELEGSEKPENWLSSLLHESVSIPGGHGRERESPHGIERMLHLVMDNIPQFIFWKDTRSVYLGCNRNFAKAAGVGDPENIVGKTDYDLAWRREEAEFFRACDRRVMENDRAEYHIIEPQRNADGKQAWLDTNKIPLHDEAGRVIGILGTYEDITERKQAEEGIRKARDELEHRVRERTVELARANEELRKVPSRLIEAQEEDRKRLAGELHDSVSQTLAALKFGIEAVLVARDRGESEWALKQLEHFVPTLQRSIEETRAIYMGLRPTVLEDMGLLAALQWLRREFDALYPMHHIELELGVAEEDVPEPLKITIFRITQEALANVAKHSKAEWVDLSLVKNAKGIGLTIADKGIGMDVSYILGSDTARCTGLISMRERAELTGGLFFLESSPGQGTTIRAQWSLEKSPDHRPLDSSVLYGRIGSMF